MRTLQDGHVGTDDVIGMLGAEAVPLAGGYSGETFLVGAAGEQAVLRLCVRQPERAAIDAALLDLVRGLVPVPRVLDLRTPEMATDDDPGPPYVLSELLPGTRLDELLPTADDDQTRVIAANLAAVLARLSGIPFRRKGEFTDADLHVGQFDTDLVEWVEQHQAAGPLSEWAAEDQAGLRALARDADDLLADEPGGVRHCLVHSDFNPKNLLVDPTTGAVTGVLDWEFAHAGSPYTDLGNLLRFERSPVFVDSVVEGYAERAPRAPVDLVERARAADLWGLVGLAGRADQHDVARRAYDLLAERVRPVWADRSHTGSA